MIFGAFTRVAAQQLNDQPVISQENIQKVAEVYGTSFVEQNPTLVAFFDRLFENRIAYQVVPQTANEKYPLISSFGINNKVNANIAPINPETFNPETFNPLTYAVGYTNKHVLIIRIDGTDYLMIVQPQ